MRNLWVAMIAVAIMAIIGWFTPVGQTVVQQVEDKAGSVSGVTNFSKLGVTELKVGSGCGDGFTYAGCTGMVINAASGVVSGLIAIFDAGVRHSYTNSIASVSTSVTLTAAQMADYEAVLYTPLAGAPTITLPASSTLSAYVPVAGDWADQCWYNAATTSFKVITFAAGTGIDLEFASTTKGAAVTPNLAILPGNSGCFRFMRQPATATTFDITAMFVPFDNAD